MKKRLVLAALLCLLLPLAACGGGPPGAGEQGTEPAETGEKRQLRISVCYDYYALETPIARFNEIHPDVEIILNKYDNDTVGYQQQVSTQLLSGTADDLLDATRLNDRRMRNSGLLADIYPLMENDPDFKEADYYMNVLDAMAKDGQLTVFPTSFGYELAAVNNTFSPELVAAYQQYDKVSYWDLFALYSGLGDTGGRYLGNNFDAATSMFANMDAFIDHETRTCSFDSPEFIDFITMAKAGTEPGKTINQVYGFDCRSTADWQAYALRYVFACAESSNYSALLPYADEQFTHFVPLTDWEGKVSLMLSKSFCINAASPNQDLAWEFLKFLTTPEANADIHIPGLPIHRELCRDHIETNLARSAERYSKDIPLSCSADEAVQQLLAQYLAWNDLPMAYRQVYYGLVDTDETLETLIAFHDGTLSAAQAASMLQNRVSLFLME